MKLCKRGFTIVEVITAIIVMSMMLVAVIGFVDYSSTIWQKGTSKVNSQNYMRMTFDLLKQDLNRATAVVEPMPGASGTKIVYLIGTATNTVRLDTDMVLKKDAKDALVATTGGGLVKKTSVLARNIEHFGVNRISTWTVQITLATEISSETMILTAPGLN